MDDIDRLRDFNRIYTRELGLLGRSYLGSGLGVGEVRVLYELAHGSPGTARDLAARLAIDEGYVSRVLQGFERRGWVARGVDASDARRRKVALTPAGQAAMTPLEARSRGDLADRLDRLGADRCAALIDGADRMRLALAEPPWPVTLTDLAPGDAGWVIMRHGALYASDEGYDIGFEALVAGIVARFVETRDPARERAWIARVGVVRLGCIFCVRETDDAARLRLFLIEPLARGQGLGRRMIEDCMAFARDRGYRRMVLWTHKSHLAACALYEKYGWRVTGEAAATAFGAEVIDQHWECDL